VLIGVLSALFYVQFGIQALEADGLRQLQRSLPDIEFRFAPLIFRTIDGIRVMCDLSGSLDNVADMAWTACARALDTLPEDIFFVDDLVLHRQTMTVGVRRLWRDDDEALGEDRAADHAATHKRGRQYRQTAMAGHGSRYS